MTEGFHQSRGGSLVFTVTVANYIREQLACLSTGNRTRHTLLRTLEGEGAPPEQKGRAACVRVCVVILRSAQQWLPPKP